MPRAGGFSAQVSAQNEVHDLRGRIAALENQLRELGVEPVTGTRQPPAVQSHKSDPELTSFLCECGLGNYAEMFQKQGYDSMDTVKYMQEHHLRELGIIPGHALKLSRKIEEYANANGGATAKIVETPSKIVESPQIAPIIHEVPKRPVKPMPPPINGHLPGIYRVVHDPRVAIRDMPATKGKVLDILQKGEVFRVSEIIPPCWARMDEDELWARWTSIWPQRPKHIDPMDDHLAQQEHADDGQGGCEEGFGSGPAPEHAYILIDGTIVKLNGALLARLSDEEADEVNWDFRDATDMRCAEIAEAHRRQERLAMTALRRRFVETAKVYVGTPFQKKSPALASTPDNSNRAFNSIQLVQELVSALRKDFGFLLFSKCSLAECYRALPLKLEASELKPGDLIFYEGTLNDERESDKGRLVHVEIFLGDETGRASIGSLPRSSHPRTEGRDGVQIFDNFFMESTSEWTVSRIHFRSLDPWLEADETSFVHAKLLLEKIKPAQLN